MGSTWPGTCPAGGCRSSTAHGRAIPPRTTRAWRCSLTQLRGSTERELFAKIVGPGTRVDHVRVHGYPALWIHGAPHEIYFRGPNGRIESDTVRLAGNVLLWQENGVILRLEGAPSLPAALAAANSLR